MIRRPGARAYVHGLVVGSDDASGTFEDDARAPRASAGGGLERGAVALLALVALLVVAVARPRSAHAQDLGHRMLGTLGLDAGAPLAPGLYVADRALYYQADALRDRYGNVIPIEELTLRGFANAVGLAGALSVPKAHATLGAAAALPIAYVRVRSERPEAQIDRFGLSDIVVKPLELGFRFDRGGVLAAYTVYVPTDRFEFGGTGVSQGHVAHQFSLGGSAQLDPGKRCFVGALVSYGLNQPKRGIDITRGDTAQIQGGAGLRPWPLLELGLAFYALWQVEDDAGQDVPEALRGARERVFGLGPELAVRIPPIRAVLRLRYETEVFVRSRPDGQVAVLGLTFAALRTEPPEERPPDADSDADADADSDADADADADADRDSDSDSDSDSERRRATERKRPRRREGRRGRPIRLRGDQGAAETTPPTFAR